MSYDVIEKSYNTLTEEQQLIVYNLILSLCKLNLQSENNVISKRVFGKFSKTAKVSFADDWEMSEEELCSL